jgi:peptidyl-prolyl cis-trans isomerase D
MISLFRTFLGTWAAKVFFALLIGVFVVWGVGDVMTRPTVNTAVATVGERRVEVDELADAYRRQLAQLQRMMGGTIEPTAEMRRAVAAQALERLITQVAMSEAVAQMGLVVPDEALREAVWSTPGFAGPGGQFNREQFLQVLRSNGLTEQRFLDLMRIEVGQRQLLEPLRAGVASPEALTRLVYAFQQEKRVADIVVLRLDAVPAPEAPDRAVLERWYSNHIDRFSTPEFRRIKAVILAPELLAREVMPDEAELRVLYEARGREFVTPERRTVQVVLSQDEAKAAALAARWREGADWAAMQQAATADGAAPVELADAVRTEIPAPELAEAIFAAAPEAVVGPVRSALGWHVLRVTRVAPGVTRSFEAVREQLLAEYRANRAVDMIYDRANKLDDLLAAGTPLDEMPGDLGMAGVTGTLDARGMTPEGNPAPIPGGDGLREALVRTAFATAKDEPPRLIEGPRPQGGGVAGFYALAVEEIIPPAARPFEEVQDEVLEDWRRNETRRTQEEAAAKLMAAVKGGQTLADAAVLADLPVQRLPEVNRGSRPAEEVPLQLVDPLFGLKPGEATMVETADGFVVAVLAEVQPVQPDADPIGFGQVREALSRTMADDLQASVIIALRARAQPQVNREMLDRIVQPE